MSKIRKVFTQISNYILSVYRFMSRVFKFIIAEITNKEEGNKDMQVVNKNASNKVRPFYVARNKHGFPKNLTERETTREL